MRTSRRILAVVAVAGLVVAGCGGDDEPAGAGTTSTSSDATSSTSAPPAGGSLTIYSGRGEDLVQPIIDRFTEQTGIDVQVRYGDSAELALLIQEEGANSPADVFWSQGAGFLGALSAAGRLVPLEAALLDQVPDQLRSPAGDWVGLSGRVRTIVYNTDELSETDVPDSVLELTDPTWKGRIGYAPTNASFQDFVTALRAVEGEDAARAWLEGIIANGAVPYEKNTAIVEAVAAGEISVGLVNHYYLYRYLAENPDFPAANKFLPGDIGGLVNIAGIGVLDTSDNQPAALALIEFLLSPEAQEYFATETYELPVVPGTPAPAELPSIESLGLPAFDLNRLLDLQGTIELLTEVGAL